MAPFSLTAATTALVLLMAESGAARTHNSHLHHLLKHRSHDLGPEAIPEVNVTSDHQDLDLKKRGGGGGGGGKCQFPDDDDLVAVTPHMLNAGWAMAPDMACECGKWCPIACKAGKVMAQWNPTSTYTYPASVDGGLYCDDDGNIQKPFEDKPYCVDGVGSITAVNKIGEVVTWCQTVLPGYEDMLIPTVIETEAVIAVPDTSYWQSTAAHFYVNGPASTSDDCKWGDESKPVGNWAPYVAGANTDDKGFTFTKIGWNPVCGEKPETMVMPTFGIRIECDDDAGCVGLPCSIPLASGRWGDVEGPNVATGAGSADFCVVTVPPGKTGRIVMFDVSGGGTGGGGYSSSGPQEEEAQAQTPSSAPPASSAIAPPPPPPPAPTTTVAPPPPPPPPPSAAVANKVQVPAPDAVSIPTTTTLAEQAGIFHEDELDVEASYYSSSASTTSIVSTSSSSTTTTIAFTTASIPVVPTSVINSNYGSNSTSSVTSSTSTSSVVVSFSNSTMSVSSPAPVVVPSSSGGGTTARPAPSDLPKSDGVGKQRGSAAVGLLIAFVATAYFY